MELLQQLILLKLFLQLILHRQVLMLTVSILVELLKGGAVAGSATDASNYTLNGAALPEGTTITLNAAKNTATITLPTESISKADTAAVFTIEKVQRATGEVIKPVTTTVATVDNVKPVLAGAVLNTDGSVSLSFSETLTATPVLSDFAFKANGKTLDVATVATIVAGTGADAGKFVIPNLVAAFSEGTDAAGDEIVYIDVDNSSSYSATNDILLKSGTFVDLAAAGYTGGKVSVKDAAITSFVIESTGTTTVLDAGSNKLKAGTTITVK